MCVYIHGFKISGYRSFGPDEQTIGPFSKINLFVGQNNCGKTNILKFITNHLSFYLTGEGQGPLAHERFGRDNTTKITFRAGLPFNHRIFSREAFPSHQFSLVERVIAEPPLAMNGLSYFPTLSQDNQPQGLTAPSILQEIHTEVTSGNAHWVDLMMRWTGTPHGLSGLDTMQLIQALTNQVAQHIRLHHKAFQKVHFLSPNRQINQDGKLADGELEWGGSMAVDFLARLQNPGSDTSTSAELHAQRKKFQAITKFFRQVVDSPTATIQASYDRKTILVDMNGTVSTLESLGTGLHQLIILAIATTALDGVIFCVEEPEMNMHPALQRRLLQYWQENTKNQYFIATHSAALIDSSAKTSVFHLTHDGIQTRVDYALDPRQRRTICDDLGFKPSDLLQANALIWVEGPSDRIYIKRLIEELAAGQLQEGSHYSFAFYGGALRAHYSIEGTTEQVVESLDTSLNDLVDLLPINRNAVMVADSDKKNFGDVVTDPHKKRLEKEFTTYSNGFYWETEGRTIENYLKQDVFAKSRAAVHPSAKFNDSLDRFTDLVTARTDGGSSWSAKKVAIARVACQEEELFDPDSDILVKGNLLVDAIKKWNGIKGLDKEV